MKTQVVRRGLTWSLRAVLLTGLVYSVSTLTLTSPPVYAATCTDSYCDNLEQVADGVCVSAGKGHALATICPIAGSPSSWEIRCQLGNVFGNCS
jgi:hypothetical protein